MPSEPMSEERLQSCDAWEQAPCPMCGGTLVHWPPNLVRSAPAQPSPDASAVEFLDTWPEAMAKAQLSQGDVEAARALVESLQTQLTQMREALANIKELGRATMATESGREIILAAIDEVLAEPVTQRGDGKEKQ